jgi:hypothetical protein
MTALGTASGSATGVRGLCSNYFYDALYAYCQNIEERKTMP